MACALFVVPACARTELEEGPQGLERLRRLRAQARAEDGDGAGREAAEVDDGRQLVRTVFNVQPRLEGRLGGGERLPVCRVRKDLAGGAQTRGRVALGAAVLVADRLVERRGRDEAREVDDRVGAAAAEHREVGHCHRGRERDVEAVLVLLHVGRGRRQRRRARRRCDERLAGVLRRVPRQVLHHRQREALHDGQVRLHAAHRLAKVVVGHRARRRHVQRGHEDQLGRQAVEDRGHHCRDATPDRRVPGENHDPGDALAKRRATRTAWAVRAAKGGVREEQEAVAVARVLTVHRDDLCPPRIERIEHKNERGEGCRQGAR